MQSRWFNLKTKAVSLRKRGHSLKDVETKLGIPRSTLSGWFRGVELTADQKRKLNDRWKQALVTARKAAVQWHNKSKEERLKNAESAANETLTKLNCKDPVVLDLALSLLYLGEGFKKGERTGMGNSDPLILKFFLYVLRKNFNISPENIRCDLHLRADQDHEKIKKYWSNELKIPLNRFKGVCIDKRTIGKPTYDDYKGVCVIECGNVAIQRRLVYLSRKYCEKALENLGG